MEEFVARYGYVAVFVGCLLEGETILILGGLAAFRGYLRIEYVIGVAIIGSFLGDQAYFYLGRRFGPWVLDRRPVWRPPADRALRLLKRFETVFILSFRFIYGIRTVSAFVIGMAKIAPMRFAALNLIAAAVWGTAVGLAGYAFGYAVEQVIEEVERYEAHIAVAVAAIGALVWAVHVARARRAARGFRPTGTDRPSDTD